MVDIAITDLPAAGTIQPGAVLAMDHDEGAGLATYKVTAEALGALPEGPDLILYSQDVPAVQGAEHYVDNAATWATLPFDGLAVYSVTGAGGVFNRATALTSGAVSAEWAGFHTASWGHMTRHWPLIRITDTNVIDLTNDTHWATIKANATVWASGIRGSMVQGILFDNEDYSPNSLFDYTSGTLATMQAWAYQRGREFMEGLIAGWSDVQVVVAHGPYVSDPKTGVDVWTDQATDPPYWNPVDAANELQGWFTFGMGEAAIGTRAKVWDGGEVYAIRNLEHVLRVRRWQLDGMPNEPGTITPEWLRGQLYPLGATQAVFDRDEFAAGAEHPLATIQTMLVAAMRGVRTGHEPAPMVWYYLEERDPYPTGLPGNTDESWKPFLSSHADGPTAYVDAIAAARAAGRA